MASRRVRRLAILAAVMITFVVLGSLSGGLGVDTELQKQMVGGAESRPGVSGNAPDLEDDREAAAGLPRSHKRAHETHVSTLDLLSTTIARWYYLYILHPDMAKGLDYHIPEWLWKIPAPVLETPGTVASSSTSRKGTQAADGADVAQQAQQLFYDAGWEGTFGSVKKGVGHGSSSDSTTAAVSVASSCTNILLQNAPWCNMNISEVSLSLDRPEATVEESDAAFVVSREEKLVQTQRETRDRLTKNARNILKDASRRGYVNREDQQQLSEVNWKDWAPHKEGKEDNTAPTPVVVKPAEVEGQGSGGSLYLRRTKKRYPILTALRRTETDSSAKQPGTHAAPFDKDEDLIGFHACMFGVRRNLTSTLERLVGNILEHMKPQRLHVVTNDFGYGEYLDNPNSTDAKAIGSARSSHFNEFLRLVSPFAASFVATTHDAATTAHNCTICRGFFPREVCRMSILRDLQDGIPVELVLMFRPDMYVFNPIYLTPYSAADDPVEAGNEAVVPINGENAAPQGSARPITRWRIHTRPMFSLIIDKGFLPGAFGVINDVNITTNTLMVHLKVTFPMDLHWIGDPVVFGHWKVMNHWMQMFSVISGDPVRYGWDEQNSGEMHHHDFYFGYIRPLFLMGTGQFIDIRPFDFQFSLYRPDPAINKQILSLPAGYAAYQQQTIFMKFATKWEGAECMRYTFVPREYNVTSFYTSKLQFQGEIGRLKLHRVPMRDCQAIKTPPGLQTCFTQYQRIIYYKKGKNIHNPCKPYCGVIPILYREGLCLHVGNKGPKKKYLATFSVSPMMRNESGEVLRFNVVNPQYVRGDKVHIKKEYRMQEMKREQQAENAAAEAAASVVRNRGNSRSNNNKKKESSGGKSGSPSVDHADRQGLLDDEDREAIKELATPAPQTPAPPSPSGDSGGGAGGGKVQVGPVFKRGSKKYRFVSRSKKG